MMESSRRPFPYPVLGNGDDINIGSYRPSCTYSLTPDSITIDCHFAVTDNEYYLDLIKNGKASYLVEVKCGNTYHRIVRQTCTPTLKIELPSTKLHEEVNVEFYICATQTIIDYLPDGRHTDFGDEAFRLEPGDVIALGGATSFIAAKDFDSLTAPVSSIVKLEQSTKNNTDIMYVSYDGDKIVIQLPKSDFEFYSAIKSSSAEMLHSAVVLPVLVDALYEISDRGSGDYKNTAWSSRLKQICSDRKIDMNEPFVAAQKILECPVNRTLKWQLENMRKMEDEQ